MKEGESERPCLLIIQCDSGHINRDLIACARYRIYDKRANALLNRSKSHHVTHVVFIVHLPVQVVRSTFVGFQGDPWVSCHIDELRPSDTNAITLELAQGTRISTLFYGALDEPGLDRQTSELSSNMEGVVFERVISTEERMEEAIEEGEREGEAIVEGEGEGEAMEDEEGGEAMEEGVAVFELGGQAKEMEIIDESGSSESRGSQPHSTEEQEEAVESSENRGSQPDSTEVPVESSQREDSSQPPQSDTQSMSRTSAAPLGTRPFSNLCVRLNSCIQAAASRLQDSSQNNQRAAERVRLLIQVIPRKPTFPLGKYCYYVLCLHSLYTEPGTFYDILVAHIHRMLCERETVYQDDDWVLVEAMNMHHLQTGGTFMNVLTRKLDDIIVPCLAEIIAFVDRRSNLSLLQIEPSPLSQFWLKLFASNRSEEALRFTDMVTNQKVQMMDENFACEFPFSWLVKELLDSLWDSALNTGGTVCVSLCLCLGEPYLDPLKNIYLQASTASELPRHLNGPIVLSMFRNFLCNSNTCRSSFALCA